MVVGTGRSRDLPAIIDRLVKMSAAEGNKEVAEVRSAVALTDDQKSRLAEALGQATGKQVEVKVVIDPTILGGLVARSEEHTSELQSLMRISYAVFCLKKQKKKTKQT